MKMDSKTMFATMSPWKLFFAVALPGMVSMFAMSIYSIFEGIFIGQKLGEAAFAAVNIAFPLVMINFSLADLVGVGASVPISIALGRKDEGTANNVFSCSIVLILLASVVMGTVMMLGAFWSFGLDGIWLNMFGTSLLALGLGIILIRFVWKSVKR